jgi:4-alpha-glucanotransferase
VLIPLFSLRGDGWGLGEIPDLVPFSAWAHAAGFGVVQILPVLEVSGGQSSPYSAQTAFALDPVYLALDRIDGLRRPDDLADLAGAASVDWGAIRYRKNQALEAGYARLGGLPDEARAWAPGEAEWLDDFTLFSALHERYQKSWEDWPEPLRSRDPAALAEARAALAGRIGYFTWLQWHLDRQWRAARAEVNRLGVKIMGDLPFMVAGDSADVWSHQGEFRLDARTGAPPDAFSADGQDWGLPVYRWDVMAAGGFRWMKERARHAAQLYDFYRVDHVVGLYRTFYREGRKPTIGPGQFTPRKEADQLILGETNMRNLGGDHVIAEDLGVVPDFVRASLDRLGIPGYRVLRWEKDKEVFRNPAKWPAVSVATTGTHDTESLADWYEALPPAERKAFWAIPGLEKLAGKLSFDDEVRDAVLAALYACPSELALIPFQDALGARERVNVPGTVTAENWSYRMPMTIAELRDDAGTTARLRGLSARTGR